MAVTKYIYDGDTVLMETDGAGVTQRTYTWAPRGYGDLLSVHDGSSTRYFEPDGLGSTDTLSNDSQAVTDRWKYRAFGAATHTTGADTNPFTWVGRQGYYSDSETGLYMLGSGTRYYARDVNQFLSNDPIGFFGGDINTRRYVRNDPISKCDPLGLAATEADCIKARKSLPEQQWYKDWLRQMTARGCKVPDILCDPGGGPQDRGSYNDRRNEIRIYFKNQDANILIQTMIHELVHAFDHCNKLFSLGLQQPWSDACSELRAYLYSGACQVPEKEGGYLKPSDWGSVAWCLLRKAADSLVDKLPNKLWEARDYVCCVWDFCLSPCVAESLAPGSGYLKPVGPVFPSKPKECEKVNCKILLQAGLPEKFFKWWYDLK